MWIMLFVVAMATLIDLPSLLQNKAPGHQSVTVQRAVCDCSFQELVHPAYSPVPAPSDYYHQSIKFLKAGMI